MARAYNDLSQELGREPLSDEIAAKLAWEVDEVLDVRSAMPDATSLNQTLAQDGSELGELVEDERASEVLGEIIGEMEVASLREAMGRLPERHRYVLIRRYGLGSRNPASLTELSAELGVCKERVRKLQREAKWALRTKVTLRGRSAPQTPVGRDALGSKSPWRRAHRFLRPPRACILWTIFLDGGPKTVSVRSGPG